MANFLKKNIYSHYPNQIDPLLFVQDANINDISFRKEYQTNYNLSKEIAVDSLANTELFTPINAQLMNTLNRRIRSLQQYLLNKEDDSIRIEFTVSEPSEIVDGKVWCCPKL